MDAPIYFEDVATLDEEVFILTNTYYFVGRVASVQENFINLAPGAQCVFNFGEPRATLDGNGPAWSTVYPYGVAVSRRNIILVSKWTGQSLPRDEGDFNVQKYLAHGSKIYVRTVTFHFVGELSTCEINTAGERFVAELLTFKPGATWVVSTGKDFAETLAQGTLDSWAVLPGPCSVNFESVIDISPWNHDMPQKR